MAIVCFKLVHLVSLPEPVLDTAWSPHVGFLLRIHSSPRVVVGRVLCEPTPLPMEAFKKNMDPITNYQKLQLWRNAQNAAKTRLSKQKAKTGRAILGTLPQPLETDPKFPNTLKGVPNKGRGELSACCSVFRDFHCQRCDEAHAVIFPQWNSQILFLKFSFFFSANTFFSFIFGDTGPSM